MRILTLGGTRFVGRHIVEEARAAGHDVAVLTRKQQPLPWDDVEQLTGDRDTGDLAALRGREWDACIDVSAYLPAWVRDSVAQLAGAVERYVFISTASVYAPGAAEGRDETAAVLPAVPEDESGIPAAELYGARKVACEQAVEAAFPARSLILRPGIVAGPFDPTNRFDWWVERVARGGEVLGPGAPETPVQLIDGRDLGAFTVLLTEALTTGIFNVCGPPSSFGELIEACRAGTGSDARATWVSEQRLLEAGVEPFAELPLWLPASDPGHRAFYAFSNARAIVAGLELRPLADTARDTLEWIRAVRAGQLPAPTAGIFVARGLSPEREAALIASAHPPGGE